MANFADLLKKMANNAPLTPQELDDLGRFGTEIQQRNSQVSGLLTIAGNLNIKLPIELIHSSGILVADSASIVAPVVPPDYNHLLLMSSGRTTNATAGIYYLGMNFNQDGGSNYAYQELDSASATLQTTVDYSHTYAIGGYFAGDSNTAGETGSNFVFIPNYRSSFHKSVICLTSFVGASAGEGARTEFIGSVWRNTSPINYISFSSGSGLKAGTLISVYGLR